MHYVLFVGVITLYIYFRFGPKALSASLFVMALLALSRGLFAFAVPLFIMAYLFIRNTDFLLELPWSKKNKGIRNATARNHGPQNHGPRNPVISSPFLKIIIDPIKNEMSGTVISGVKKGQSLSSLSFAELNELLIFYSSKDKTSEQILISYMDLNHDSWRKEVRGYYETEDKLVSSTSSRITRREAIEILGLSSHPTNEEVKANHRLLMKRFHPDQGGSPFLAAKINMAKDCLLG
jgi:hypothetical protein